MARSYVSWDSFSGIMTILAWTADPDLSDLCEILRDVIFEDNKRGVLAGLDKDGMPMAPTVRESTPEGHWVRYRLPDGKPARYFQAGSSPTPGAPPWVSEGSGPPLAPRREQSRVIANLATTYARNGPSNWVVTGTWEDVVSTPRSGPGVSFLPFHFEGQGRLPTRDLAGLRPQGLQEALEIVSAWTEAQIDARFRQAN